MSNSIRKLIKYLVIFALLGAVVFFGVKILYPTPSNSLAFEKTLSLVNNQNFEANQTAVYNFEVKFKNEYAPDHAQFTQLSHSRQVLEFQNEVLNQILPELAFAKNSPVYNLKANQINSLEKELTLLLEEAASYIDLYVAPALENSQVPSTLNALLANLLKNNKTILNKQAEYLDAVTTIFIDFKTTFSVNAYSKKIVQIISTWASAQNKFINDAEFLEGKTYTTEKGISNLNQLKAFKNTMFTSNNFLSYNTDKESLNTTLQSMSKADMMGLVSSIEVYGANNFTQLIENEEIKTHTIALQNFILGGE